jgi:hypothetical protein
MPKPAPLRLFTAAAALAAILPLGVTGAALAAPATRTVHPAAAPGRTAGNLTLDNNVEFSGYDAAVDPSGNTYIGWISDKKNHGRKVHLCTIPVNANKCMGGVQTIDSLGDSSAEGLKVLVSSAAEVTLVWFHDTTASTMGRQGGEIATATSDAGGPLNGPFDLASAPSFGSLLDARLGPGNAVWTVAAPPAGKSGLQVHDDIVTPGNLVTVLKTPYQVQDALLRFHGNDAVLAIQKDGAITVPVAYASNRGEWTQFRKLARTWTSDSILGLVGTKSGIRLVTAVNNASYHPVSWSWTGNAFARPTLTGDFSHCSPNSHDLVSDNSGRVADVSRECDDIAIANLTDTRHAAVVRFPGGGPFAGGDPQLTTTSRGQGRVVWSIESKTGNKLLTAPILLPGRDVTASKTARGNRVTVTGPASCLPAVIIKIGVKGSPAENWHVVTSSLRLNTSVLTTTMLPGALLSPGGKYTLSGTVKFADGGAHTTVTAKLKFRSCPNG